MSTIADGLRAAISERTFAGIRAGVSQIVTVSDDAIVRAMRRIWEELKVIAEPSAAVAYAAVLDGKVDVEDRRIGIILTGGNLDLDRLPWQA